MTPEREEKIINVIKHRQPTLTLIFENVWDPHNISAVLRTADSVGVCEVHVIQYSARTVKLGNKSSSSARKWVKANYYSTVAECMQVLKPNFKIAATHLGASSVNLFETDLTQPIAIAFGNESEGVSEELLKHSDFNIHIPQVGMIQSLNISVACAVTLYEAYRQRSIKGFYKSPQLPESELMLMNEEWKMK